MARKIASACSRLETQGTLVNHSTAVTASLNNHASPGSTDAVNVPQASAAKLEFSSGAVNHGSGEAATH